MGSVWKGGGGAGVLNLPLSVDFNPGSRLPSPSSSFPSFFVQISTQFYRIFYSISHVLNEQGTEYQHIFSSVRIVNID